MEPKLVAVNPPPPFWNLIFKSAGTKLDIWDDMSRNHDRKAKHFSHHHWWKTWVSGIGHLHLHSCPQFSARPRLLSAPSGTGAPPASPQSLQHGWLLRLLHPVWGKTPLRYSPSHPWLPWWTSWVLGCWVQDVWSIWLLLVQEVSATRGQY